jgi:ribose transport system permease protein
MVGKRIKHILKSKEMLLVLISIVIIVIFRLVNPNFLSAGSLSGIMQAMSITGILAVGIGTLLIGGSIDLSGSQVCLFGGVICALMMKAGVPWVIAVVITLIAGGVIGGINAFLISKLNMMAFIATIAVSNVLSGINLAITNAQNVPIPVESFWWGGKLVFKVFPVPFIIMTLLMIVYSFVLNKTQFGRNVYLVGGNMAAARLAGVNPKKVRTILYINSGVLAAFSGIVLASRMQSAAPQSQSDTQLNALTAAILGGIAFTGGAGGMAGCFIGVMLFSFFNSGLNSLAIDAYWSLIASGCLLVIALTVDFFNERSREKNLRMKKPAQAANKESA